MPAGTVLVSDDDGRAPPRPDGPRVVKLTEEPAERAYDDGAGGFLFEAAVDGRPTTHPSQAIQVALGAW